MGIGKPTSLNILNSDAPTAVPMLPIRRRSYLMTRLKNQSALTQTAVVGGAKCKWLDGVRKDQPRGWKVGP